MTKSTITRERLEKIKSWRETYGAGSNVMLPAEEAEELARMALAAMDGEPVAWLLSGGGAKNVVCFDSGNAYADPLREVTPLYADPRPAPTSAEPFAYIIQDKYERERGVEGHLSRSHVSKYVSQEDISEHEITCTPLYRHAQQPVVPDESYKQLSELYHTQEKRLFKIAQRIKGPTFDKYSHLSSQAIDVLEAAIFGEDDTCRAAMLAAAPQSPGSEPATVPGKWIPASERMPEPGILVLVYTPPQPGDYPGDVRIGFDYIDPDGDDPTYWFNHGENYEHFCCVACDGMTGPSEKAPYTHWIPLPAGPKEKK